MTLPKIEIKKIVRFIGSGSMATLADVILIYFFVEVLHFWYVYSAVIAYGFSFVIGFFLQKIWTFEEDHWDELPWQMFLYFIVGTINLFLDMALIYALVDFLHIYYIFAQVIAVSILGINSFVVYTLIIFRNKKNENNSK